MSGYTFLTDLQNDSAANRGQALPDSAASAYWQRMAGPQLANQPPPMMPQLDHSAHQQLTGSSMFSPLPTSASSPPPYQSPPPFYQPQQSPSTPLPPQQQQQFRPAAGGAIDPRAEVMMLRQQVASLFQQLQHAKNAVKSDTDANTNCRGKRVPELLIALLIFTFGAGVVMVFQICKKNGIIGSKK